MKPTIDHTIFGSITVEGHIYAHDVLIRRGGRVKKRKKKLSRAVYGTSHILSLAEAKHVYEPGTSRLIIGSGQEGNVRLSEEAAAYFGRKRCQVELLPQTLPGGAAADARGHRRLERNRGRGDRPVSRHLLNGQPPSQRFPNTHTFPRRESPAPQQVIP